MFTTTELDAALRGLSREDLRRLAWKVLMLSDGPDRIHYEGEDDKVQDSKFNVTLYVTKPLMGFLIQGLDGWKT